jgi:hypothetical protein
VKVRVLSPAQQEIAAAAEWFEQRRMGLGHEFWKAVDSILDRIETNPGQFARSEFATDGVDLRFALVDRFRYVIHFLVNGDDIQILSVAHGSRNPGYWRDRF